jgi:hypothetical protein
MPLIFPQSEQKLRPPECANDLLTNESDRAPVRWYARIAVTKGGAAGKGPDPPEPPPMSTDGSAQYPNMMEELDGGEIEGKTRMAFAKMQIPSNLKESYLLTDQDFTIFDEKDDQNSLTGEVQNNAGDLLLETIDDPASLNASQTLNSTTNPNNVNAAQEGETSTKDRESRKTLNKTTSRAKNSLSRSSTANSIGDGNTSGNNSINGNDSADEKHENTRRSGRKSKVTGLPSMSTSPTTSPDGNINRKARKTLNKNVSKSEGAATMSEQAAKLGLYA